MPSDVQTVPIPKGRLWAGRIMSGLTALFLLFGGVMDLVKPPYVVEGTLKMGYPENIIFGLGVVVLACTILYLIPRTAVLGVILLTGYLGGAVATHVRMNDLRSVPVPVVVAALLWGGLWLRDSRLRALIPLRS
ncbi:MAG TPA: DoxX family protein [Thermoanaerobaculia bacterium]|nr:DoxX family protein [Thermoanaerobaculia bacterium]